MIEIKAKTTPIQEQETVINIQRDSNKASIWTNDLTMYTKLDKLVKQAPGEWKQTEQHTINGEICSKSYECSKNLISFRTRKTTREFTEEQKEQLKQRLKASRQ